MSTDASTGHRTLRYFAALSQIHSVSNVIGKMAAAAAGAQLEEADLTLAMRELVTVARIPNLVEDRDLRRWIGWAANLHVAEPVDDRTTQASCLRASVAFRTIASNLRQSGASNTPLADYLDREAVILEGLSS